jgi:hypothetical protein
MNKKAATSRGDHLQPLPPILLKTGEARQVEGELNPQPCPRDRKGRIKLGPTGLCQIDGVISIES